MVLMIIMRDTKEDIETRIIVERSRHFSCGPSSTNVWEFTSRKWLFLQWLIMNALKDLYNELWIYIYGVLFFWMKKKNHKKKKKFLCGNFVNLQVFLLSKVDLNLKPYPMRDLWTKIMHKVSLKNIGYPILSDFVPCFCVLKPELKI